MKARNHPVDFTRQAKKLAKHYARYLDALRKEYLRHNTSLYRVFGQSVRDLYDMLHEYYANPTGQPPPRLGGGSVAPDCSPEQYLASENNALRKAGCKLAEAALYVAREYDGVHRLMLAVAEWAKAVADEGGRGRANDKAQFREERA
jgi:hypothetical protein